MKNQEAWRFSVQFFMSTAVLGFCMFKLTMNDQNSQAPLYWGGITAVLAWWMPSPGGSSKENSNSVIPQRVASVQSIND